MSVNYGKDLMKGKKGLILGLANEQSIAWSIAELLNQHGAEMAFTYVNDTIKKRVVPLAAKLNDKFPTFQCDVSKEQEIENLYTELNSIGWDKLDFIVHAVAFSDKNELTGRYINTSKENFLNSMNISCYSLTAISRVFEPMMIKNGSGSIITLTYYGAEKVMPHYNVMGVCKAALEASVKYLAVDMGPKNIRVNGISAGPIRTLSSAGIGDFRYILDWNKNNAPMRRNVTQAEVAGSALYLLSDLGSGTTGEIIHVDCGYNVIGMKAVDAPDIDVV
jgi:enoyl-[acyl-carrier protein] reductase I